jgi:hypothetical protein
LLSIAVLCPLDEEAGDQRDFAREPGQRFADGDRNFA